MARIPILDEDDKLPDYVIPDSWGEMLDAAVTGTTRVDLIKDNVHFPRPAVRTWIAQGWLASGVYPSQMLPGDRYDRIAKPSFDLLKSFDWQAVFSAEHLTGLTVGDAVTTWPDMSDYGRDAVAASWATATPTYQVDVNNNPLVRFPPNSPRITPAFAMNQPFTMIAIGQIKANASWILTTGASGARIYKSSTGSGVWRLNAGTNVDNSASQGIFDRRSFIARVNSTSSDFRMGRLPVTADTETYYKAGDAGAGQVNHLCLAGWDSTVPKSQWSVGEMDLHFAGIVPGFMSDSDVAAIRAYFAAKLIPS